MYSVYHISWKKKTAFYKKPGLLQNTATGPKLWGCLHPADVGAHSVRPRAINDRPYKI
jgi:hypothetical protein